MKHWFWLRAMPAVAVCVSVGGCHLPEYLGTAEGQEAAGQTFRGASGVAANPVNPFAWYDLIMGGAMLALGGTGVIVAGKGGGAAVKRVGAVIKDKVLNKEPAQG